MHKPVTRHTSSWTNFIYGSFGTSVLMIAVGLFFLEADLWVKGFFAMGIIMLVQSAIALTKTIRDNAEAAYHDDITYQDDVITARLHRATDE